MFAFRVTSSMSNRELNISHDSLIAESCIAQDLID